MRSGADGSPHGLADALVAHVLEARQVVDAGAADDAEHGLGHALLPRSAARSIVPKLGGPSDLPDESNGSEARARRLFDRVQRPIARHGVASTSRQTFFLVK